MTCTVSESRLVKLPVVRQMLGGVSAGTIEDRIRAGLIPAPVRQGQQRLWPEIEILAIGGCIAAGWSSAELIDLAKRLVAERPKRAARALQAAIGEAS